HWVAAGIGIPSRASSFSKRWNGVPLPYLSCAIIAAAVSSYFSGPTPSGSGAVNTCPQPLQRVYRGRQGCLYHNPHQHLRLFLSVYVPFSTLRAAVPVLQILVSDVDLLCAAKRLGAIASVSRRRGWVGIRLSPGAHLRTFWFFQHGAGLLRIARPHQHCRQGMQCAFEFVVIGLAQRRLPR